MIQPLDYADELHFQVYKVVLVQYLPKTCLFLIPVLFHNNHLQLKNQPINLQLFFIINFKKNFKLIIINNYL